jgi:glycosyltransferase involved in cell wall biosynthesis
MGTPPGGAPNGRRDRSLRVLHVATSDMTLRYLLFDQLLYLKAAGHEVSAMSGPGPWSAQLTAAGIPVDTIPLTRSIAPLRDLVAFGVLAYKLARTRPDLVHTHTPKASLLGQWAALAAGIRRRVHTSHGLYFPGHMRPERRWFYVWLERLQMLPAHRVLIVSPEDLETCRRDRICDPEKLRYLGSGIDVERFHPRVRTQERIATAREELGIPDGNVVVGMVARVVREKGYLEYFAAAKKVLATRPATTFLVIGQHEPWKADAISDDEIASFGLGAALKTLGHRDDMLDLYAAMDVLTLPSHREGFPYAPMEAAATGLPVVVSDVRGCRETLIAGETGLLVPPRDPNALADALIELLDDQAKRSRFGANGRRLAEERFDQRLVFERVAKAYAELEGTTR